MPNENLEFPDELDLSLDPNVSNEEMDQEKGSEGSNDSESEEELIIPGQKPETEEDIDNDDQTKQAPAWVKNLRKEFQETKKINRELKRKLEERNKDEYEQEELGPEPKFEDFDHDEKDFKAAHKDWVLKSERIERQKEEQKKAEEDRESEWNQKLTVYHKQRNELALEDFDDLAAEVEAKLTVPQIGMIIDAAENSAQVISVLGANPKKLDELAKIKNPVKFAFAVGKLEAVLGKIPHRKNKIPPEKRIVGNATLSGDVHSKELDRLRDEAAKTGDTSKLFAYKRKMRQSGK